MLVFNFFLQFKEGVLERSEFALNQKPTPVMKTDCLSILQWYLQQLDDNQGGKWSLKDQKSGLYLSLSVHDGAIQAVTDVFAWDLQPSSSDYIFEHDYYQ